MLDVGLGLWRRHAGGDDIASLATALGDDGSGNVLLALYDVRSGVTVDTGDVVSNWSAAYGAAGVPDLVAAGAARPAFTGGAIVTDGLATFLASAASALFALNGALTLFAVALWSANRTNSSPSIDDGTAARGMSIGPLNDINANIYGYFHGAIETLSTTAVCAVRRLALVAKNASTTGVAEVPDVAQQTRAITAIAAGNNALRVGKGAANALHAATHYAVGVLAGSYTTAQRDALKAWAVANHSVVLA